MTYPTRTSPESVFGFYLFVRGFFLDLFQLWFFVGSGITLSSDVMPRLSLVSVALVMIRGDTESREKLQGETEFCRGVCTSGMLLKTSL